MGSYWRTVLSRAGKEALASSPLSSPVRIIATLAVAVATGFAIYAATGRIAWGTVAGIAALVIVILGAFIWRTAAVPAALHTEQQTKIADLEREIATYRPDRWDGDILAGVEWIRRGAWGPEIDAGDINHASILLEEIRERAHRGLITIWGRRNQFALHAAIPPDHWEREFIDLQTVWVGAPDGIASTRLFTADHFRNLAINRAQFEREWPRASRPPAPTSHGVP